MSVHTLSTTTPYPIESTVSSPIPCHLHHVAEHEDRGLPTEKELSSCYPGAIKPVPLLQLQRRHVPHPAQGCEEESLFYNCTTPKHKVPPAPLHHTLELHDQTSLLSAAAPSHIHTQGGGWYNRKGGLSRQLAAGPGGAPGLTSSTSRSCKVVQPTKSTGSSYPETAKSTLCIETI